MGDGRSKLAQRCSSGFRKMSRGSVPLRLCSTMIRWLEALRAPEVSKWQHTSRVEWDATDGRKVGAERSVDKKRRRKV